MSWNGHPVIDLDAHIVERADRFYRVSENAMRLCPRLRG